MEVFIAKAAGACYGVNRSLDYVKKASTYNKKVATLGELIHNPLVVSDLSKKYNILVVNSIEQAIELNVETLIIRSHGVEISILDKAKKSGIEIIDATCPYVKNVQNTAMMLANLYPAVIIIGKAEHPEIKSVSSFVKQQNTQCFIFESVEQANKAIKQLKSINDSIGVVSQTTQSVEVFNKIVKHLISYGLKLEIKNTICSATKKRQQSAINLAKNVDAMIVLGGKNSSNTNYLTKLCKKNCKYVYHIEDVKEFDKSWIDDVNKLGITAGASTPKSQIEYLENTILQYY